MNASSETNVENLIASQDVLRNNRRKLENGLLYALRLITYVQENEREKMVQEMEAREDEKKDKKLKKALLDE